VNKRSISIDRRQACRLMLAASAFGSLKSNAGMILLSRELSTRDARCLAVQSGALASRTTYAELGDSLGVITANQRVSKELISVARRYNMLAEHLPGLRYAFGSHTDDAWVDPESMVKGHQFTMILGKDRVFEQIIAIDDHYSVGLQILLAHEMAHVCQMRSKMVDSALNAPDLGVRFLEQHADYMAGWCFGMDRTWDGNALARAITDVTSWGDSCVNSPDSHGFGHERAEAFAEGFKKARHNVAFDDMLSLGKAYVSDSIQSAPPATDECGP
jgi:hypothetical protein